MDVQETPTAGAWGEWNPTEDSARPLRGKHRVLKTRGGLARSSTVLGVGVIAAVGAGGIATAQDRPQVSISVPDLLGGGGHSDTGADDVRTAAAADGSGTAAAGATQTAAVPQQGGDAGEALLNRILQQAESQQDADHAQARADAERTAREAAAQEAKVQKEAADKEAETARAAAEQAAAAEKEAAEKAAAEQTATKAATGSGSGPGSGSGSQSADGWSLPTSSYTLTSHYGVAGSMWSSGYHTGLDFAAPTGTPVKAVGGGKVISAGWSGAYGYRIVLKLDDGTEIWYCHLSSMSVTSGSVGAGETIGRVGATGNVTGAHLHLEVRKGGSTVDPLAWLGSKGLDV
ncbi:M23 family metallopeptidase [Streptomyces sp. C]|uniref:M23 family metallopeptidase n=1 Tax=Streptomyces sp. C TaxID=253839 RepID=UPI001F50B1CE|nr:M23 family metallopeptidase [Streptomyces sp. C]